MTTSAWVPDAIEKRERNGYLVLEAVTHAGSASSTYSAPNTFIAIDGKTYWVKGHVQQGLVAELIAGRLAARVGAGPMARIIRVTEDCLPDPAATPHLLGVVVGSEDMPNCVNARDLTPLLNNGSFQPGGIDPGSRARAVVFQTWLGVADTQVLVKLDDGMVLSIDHGDCFGNTSGAGDPLLTFVPIPGVDDRVGRELPHVRTALSIVEAVSDSELLDVVSGIPSGSAWKSPMARRLEIARWLSSRRQRLRKVTEAWAKT